MTDNEDNGFETRGERSREESGDVSMEREAMEADADTREAPDLVEHTHELAEEADQLAEQARELAKEVEQQYGGEDEDGFQTERES